MLNMSKFHKNLIAATVGLTILSKPIVAGNVQYGSNDDFTDSIPTDRLPEALRHAQDEVEEARKYDYKIRQEISDDRLKIVENAIKAREDKAAQEISDERLKIVENAIKAGEDPIKAIEARDKEREEREERV